MKEPKEADDIYWVDMPGLCQHDGYNSNINLILARKILEISKDIKIVFTISYESFNDIKSTVWFK